MPTVCPACGKSMNGEDLFCRVCGRQTAGAAPVTIAPGFVGTPETSGKAIISLVCGLLFFIPLAFIAAIVFGHLGLSEIRRSAGRLKGQGMAIAGLVLGYGWFLFIPIVLIIAAIAIPNLLRARMAANESSAVGSVRFINTAEITYISQHPNVGYTCSISDLSQQIDSELASGRKSGYSFELTGCSAGAEGAGNIKYQVIAYPTARNQTGVRAFCSDESAVIRVDSEGSGQKCLENGSPLH
jgi:type IV pilus assembly protein PilA